MTLDAPATAKKEPSSFLLVISLTLIGLVSGAVLAAVYVKTKPMIDANKAAFLEEKLVEIFKGKRIVTQKLVPLEGKMVVAATGDGAPGVLAVYTADGKAIAYGLIGKGQGYAADGVELLFAYDPISETVVGMRALDSKETPGFGTRMEEEPFQSNFKTLSLKQKVVLVDFGKKSQAHEVDAISGATVTSGAVVAAANYVREKWLPQLPKPGSEPAFQKKAQASEGGE